MFPTIRPRDRADRMRLREGLATDPMPQPRGMNVPRSGLDVMVQTGGRADDTVAGTITPAGNRRIRITPRS